MNSNLSGANLIDTNINASNLLGTDLSSSNLNGTSLRGANLPEDTFVLYGYEYFVSIENGKTLRADYLSHTIEEWRTMTKEQLIKMDGERVLNFYPKILDILDFFIGKGERPEWVNARANNE